MNYREMIWKVLISNFQFPTCCREGGGVDGTTWLSKLLIQMFSKPPIQLMSLLLIDAYGVNISRGENNIDYHLNFNN